MSFDQSRIYSTDRRLEKAPFLSISTTIRHSIILSHDDDYTTCVCLPPATAPAAKGLVRSLVCQFAHILVSCRQSSSKCSPVWTYLQSLHSRSVVRADSKTIFRGLANLISRPLQNDIRVVIKIETVNSS